MTVTVRLHGPLADRAGRRELRLSVPAGADTERVWQALAEAAPDTAAHRGRCALAVNGDWAGEAARVADGDEIDVVPPVSGG